MAETKLFGTLNQFAKQLILCFKSLETPRAGDLFWSKCVNAAKHACFTNLYLIFT